MKRLITICAVVGLVLSSTCVSWATVVTPPSTGDPSWWNTTTGLYAYGYWSADIIQGGVPISPPDNPSHWASNYLNNTDFKANIATQTIDINLGNVFHKDLQKQIYVYITGTTTSTQNDILSSLDTDSGTFAGSFGGDVGDGLWSYTVDGVITPQPEYVKLTLTVPGMTSVTNIWAGENCVPEPATVALLTLGGLAMLRRRNRFSAKCQK